MKKSLVAFSGLMLFSMQVMAADPLPLRPGLWEHSFTMKSESGRIEAAMAEMQRQLEGLPPAQRKMMEDMMAAQGVKMGQGGAGMTVQVCITPEMAARQEVPVQTEGDCTSKIDSRTGNTMKVSFSCTNPPSSGQGTYTFRGDTGYDMDMTVRSQQGNKPTTMNLKGKGRFLAASCGNVKPLGAMLGKQ